MDDAPQVLPERFELIREVGAGGMGVVYEAHDQVLGRTVAVKVFHDRSPETIDRVKQEFRVAAAVRHPNLVRLGELFEHDGSLCFSMELVHGVGLSTWVRAGDHHARVRAAIGQVAGALAALHRAGVVHRDVKPSNVVVTPDERVVLLDLGLAATIGGKALEVAGTVEYVAPESLTAAAPTPAIDLYALGVTGFELLTGRTPFDGTPAEILVAKSQREPPTTTGVAGLLAPLDDLITAMLARDPRARPTAREVEAQLGPAAAPAPATRRRRGTARQPALIGRAEELATLLAATEDLGGDNRTTLFLVRGAAGVGKTALLAAFATAAAARGHVVAMGRCSAREHLRYNAWDALIDELAHYLAQLPADARAAIVPERAEALTRLFPSFGRVAEVAHPSAESLDEVVGDAVSALRAILRRVARSHRVVSILDDAHGATEDSFALLLETLRAPSPPCVVVFCVRLSPHLPASAQARLEQLRQLPIDLRVLDVRPLAPDDAIAFGRRLTGDAALGRRIGLAASGNPTFVELLASDPDTEARDVRELLARRVAQLGGDAARVLRMIAAAGEPLAQEVIGHALAMGHDTLASVLESLADHGLVRLAGLTPADTCELMHEPIAAAVGANAADPELVAEHRHLASALDELEPGGPRSVEHWVAAGDGARAAAAALTVCDRARDVVGMARAAALCELVLSRARPANPATFVGRYADALASSGQGERAAEAYRAASVDATGSQRLDLERAAAAHFLRCGRLAEGAQLARRVAVGLGLDLDVTAGRMLGKITLERIRNRWRGMALAAAPSPHDGLLADACYSLSNGMAMIDLVRAAWFTSRGVRHALDSGAPDRAARALAMEAALLAGRGRAHTARARETLAQARAFATRAGDPSVLALTELAAGLVALQLCDYRATRDHCERAVAMFRTGVAGVAFEQHIAEYYALVADYWLGAWGRLAVNKQALVRVAEATQDRFARLSAKSGVGMIGDLIAGTSPDVLHAEIDAGLRAWPRPQAPAAYLRQLVAATMVDRYHGRDAAAVARLDAGWPHLTRTRALSSEQARGTLLALRAKAYLRVERFADARADARALRGIAAMSGPAALIEAAIAHVTGGDAAALLDEGIDACAAVGYEAYVAAARERRGRLRGGDVGAGARLVALDQASRLGLGDPDRAFDFLVPWA